MTYTVQLSTTPYNSVGLGTMAAMAAVLKSRLSETS